MSLSRFNGHFPGEAKNDGGSATSYKTCKAPVKSSPTKQHTTFLRAECTSCCPTNSVSTLKRQIKSAEYNHSHATKMRPFKVVHTLVNDGSDALVHRSNFSRMPFQMPPKTHIRTHTQVSWVHAQQLNAEHGCFLFPCYRRDTIRTMHSEETQTLCAGCSEAEPKLFTRLQTFFPGVRDGQNLISWRWSLPLPTNPVW